MEFFRSSFCKRPGKKNDQVYEEPDIIDDHHEQPSEIISNQIDMVNIRRSSLQLCDSRRNKLKSAFLSSLRQKLHRKDNQSRRRCGESHFNASLNSSSKNACKPDDKMHASNQNTNTRPKKHSSKSRNICPLRSPIMCTQRCSSTEDSGSSVGPQIRLNDETAYPDNSVDISGIPSSEEADSPEAPSQSSRSSLELDNSIYGCSSPQFNPENSISSPMSGCSNASNNRMPSLYVSFGQLDKDLDASSCKTTLSYELFRLSRYGWYWGPISRSEAEERLSDQCDGAFLVRDSSDDRYFLSLSFRSFGKTLHTRLEYCNGLFSFYKQQSDGKNSVVELIDHIMACSLSGIFCYSRARNPSAPSFPVRLTKPISRFTHVRSLQHLCRFVIRQYTRVDHIQNLPLPRRIKGYVEEKYY